MNLLTTEQKIHFKQFANDIDKHEIFTLAGSLAYTNALAFAPFVLISISFASFLGLEIQKKIYNKVTLTMGENVTNTIFEIVKNLGLDKHVVFTDYISEKDKPALLAGAKV